MNCQDRKSIKSLNEEIKLAAEQAADFLADTNQNMRPATESAKIAVSAAAMSKIYGCSEEIAKLLEEAQNKR